MYWALERTDGQTKPESKVKVICIPTNEELAICRDTVEIVTKKMVEDTVKDVLGNN